MSGHAGIFTTEGRRFVCDECRLPFPPHTGGLCAACGRTLCDDHLFGRFALWQRWLGRTRPCVRCRTATPAPGGRP